MHEAQMWPDNCFITLTYADEHLPEDKSLNVRHFQLFMKKLRKQYSPRTIRLFHCGEYSDPPANRPHYHALLFNFDFVDKKLHTLNRDGHRLYTSPTLERLWPFGYSIIGSVSFQSAAYVARYCVKKVTGTAAAAHYAGRKPDYATMSRRPGIGSTWYEKYKTEVYPSDFVVRNGAKMRPPKAYDRYLELEDAKLLEQIKITRIRNAKRHSDDLTVDRRASREIVQEARAKMLKRGNT